MKRTKVVDALKLTDFGSTVNVKGWVRTHRSSKAVDFIALNDGSTIKNIQVVVDPSKFDAEMLKQITTGSCISATGVLVESQGAGQTLEIQCESLEVYGLCGSDYPMQKKGQSFEYMRQYAHMRLRTNTFGAVMRIRHNMAMAIHTYFHEHGFFYFHSPIITASDCEGAGQMFQVTTKNLYDLKKDEDGKIKYDDDFFGKQTSLTVSGQLEGELGATALGAIYTFGPTFRAENSNTPRHLAEFWMVEPEVAFIDLTDLMDLEEDFIKYCIRWALEHCQDDLEFLNKMIDKQLIATLESVVKEDFVRLTYTEGINILEEAVKNGRKFEFPITGWGMDLSSEHERYLVEEHFKRPVIMTDYPKEIKAFYMKKNADDKTMQGTDVLFPRIGEIFNSFYSDHLPFSLTDAQKRVMREIRSDLGSGRQMNRLLQGDVGSGKTLVALMTMLIALDNGYQACIMAPTEILAEQHLATIREFLGDMDIRVELLTGIVKGKRRKTVLGGLASGSVDILVGTHAVIEDTVQFSKLGLVVVDEQHRFGVAQRARLWSKSQNPPHVLVMTATPIPRTLAMTIYGDLDVSVIDQLPPGRKPIVTIHKYNNQTTSLYSGIRQQIKEGRQVYIVFPLIKESEKLDIQNLEEGFEILKEVFPEFRLSKVHGKMKPAEKDEEMQKFVNGETQILVATTVIEVGVNVPNASVMVILNAERFGLSQLHQLRGRVGRGASQSYCILVTKPQLTNETRKRIDIMCDTNDGFLIAEADLKLRGPGDLEGTQQSGMAFDLKIADIARDGQIVQMAREEAQKIIEQDPECNKTENSMLWQRLAALRKTNVNWAAIS